MILDIGISAVEVLDPKLLNVALKTLNYYLLSTDFPSTKHDGVTSILDCNRMPDFACF